MGGGSGERVGPPPSHRAGADLSLPLMLTASSRMDLGSYCPSTFLPGGGMRHGIMGLPRPTVDVNRDGGLWELTQQTRRLEWIALDNWWKRLGGLEEG